MGRKVYEIELAGFSIALWLDPRAPQHRRYSVTYGLQTDSGLTYATAAAKLGEAILHALTCEGKMDV